MTGTNQLSKVVHSLSEEAGQTQCESSFLLLCFCWEKSTKLEWALTTTPTALASSHIFTRHYAETILLSDDFCRANTRGRCFSEHLVKCKTSCSMQNIYQVGLLLPHIPSTAGHPCSTRRGSRWCGNICSTDRKIARALMSHPGDCSASLPLPLLISAKLIVISKTIWMNNSLKSSKLQSH